MLPATLVTFATFLLELCTTSPVYNMQPAFITANIGTTGRNIRNLPCISRKSNQSGVCMFAIDCLKSNGTHLGTCIDRFYFGSCCHIEPIHDIIENTIETDIIPAREPPHRLTSTLRPLSTTIQYKTDATPLLLNTTKSISTTKAPTTTTTKGTTTRSTTAAPITTSSTSTTSRSTSTTSRTTSTTSRTTSTTSRTTSPTTPTTSISPTTSSSKNTTPKRKITTISTTTSRPKPTSLKAESTTVSYKLTTFQSVESSSATATTDRIIVPSSTTAKTPRPKPSSVKPRPSTKPTLKPKPSKIPTKPSRGTTKPTRITTRRPSTAASTATRKPTGTKPTKRITTVTTPEKTSSRPTTETTRLPSLGTSSSKPPTVFHRNSTTQQTKPPAVLHRNSTTQQTKPPAILHWNSTTQVTKPPVVLHRNSTTQENVTVNEIETSSTTKATIVTWTVTDFGNSSTAASSANTTSSNSTSEEWVPLTTPDGWVLLPSVPSTSTAGGLTVFTTINQEPVTSSSVSTSSPSASSTIYSTSSTHQQPSTTTESASKPSITYIPLETTTSATLNNTSSSAAMATEGASTQSTPVTTATPSTTSSLPTLDMTPVNMSDFTDVCGRRMYPEARIVGGEKSSFGKWPWQISLRQWRTSTYLHKCGAALLNENWAITAAHCVDNVPPSDLLLRLGEHDLSTESEPYLHQERRVQIVASHPQFDPRTFEYDLALLRFYEPVMFQPNILPVCVPQTDENFVGRTAYVTGWGRLYEDGPLPSVLQEVSVPVINNSVCESMYRAAGYIEHIPHIFICAGWRRGGFDSCEGDSGGPMVIQRDDRRFLLAGVISWGIGCAEPNQPGVYTRISEFRDWINQILQF